MAWEIHMQKSVLFLYVRNELSEQKEIKTSAVYNSINKHFRIHLSKEIIELHIKNYKTTKDEH